MSTIRLDRPIGITMGDPSGIGPEIIVRSFLLGTLPARRCLVYGAPQALHRAQAAVLRSARGGLGPSVMPMPIVELEHLRGLDHAPPGCIPVLAPHRLPPGLPPWGAATAQGGDIAAQCIEAAAKDCLTGKLSALTTAPVSKEALAAAGLDFPGHTEMLQAMAAKHQGLQPADVPVRMMLANSELRTVLCSIHTSLSQAIAAVTIPNVVETIRITHESLSGILQRPPRIAVAGLNPHAGEGGLFGREEIDIIGPAVDLAKAAGAIVSGPWPPDTVFMQARANPEFADAVVAMYHDQGLIPIKYLGVQDGVNVTLGLPFIRTSPDHGTAFDIAGKGIADASSMSKALGLASGLADQLPA